MYVQETVSSGGVERRKLSVARLLAKEKYEIVLVCTYARGKIIEEFEEVGVRIIQIGQFKNIFHLAQYIKLLKLIKIYKPHIIHGAVFEGVTMACVAGKIAQVPIIIAEETSDPQNRSLKASKLLKFLTFAADRVIAIAPAVADYLRDVARISSKKICTINNGVEIPRVVTEQEKAIQREKYKIKENDLVVGCVGRLQNDHKRFTDIIEAVRLLPMWQNIKILIVGSGRNETLLKNIAEEQGLAKQLILVGHQHDTAPFYEIMDIFCLASQREGFGLVAVEAMLHKLPTVVTNVGGLKNIVIANETGFLVPPLQPTAIAEKLQMLIEKPMLRAEMGEKGYLRAIKEFTASVYVAKVEKLYEDLLAEKKINEKY